MWPLANDKWQNNILRAAIQNLGKFSKIKTVKTNI